MVALGGAWRRAYAAVWAATVASAAAVTAAGRPVRAAVRRTFGLTLHAAAHAPPTAGGVFALAVHNAPVAAWPLLLTAVGANRSRGLRVTADLAVVVCLLANTIPVGAALGGYGPALVPFVVQLPVEWAALAVGYGSWLRQRRTTVTRRWLLGQLALLVGLVIVAAALETYATPHR